MIPASPFRRDVLSLRDAISQLVEESAVLPKAFFDSPVSFESDLRETPDAYVLTASVPGVKPEDIEIAATADSVTIKGEYKSEADVKESTYLRHERRSGSFERSFSLPVAIEPEKVVAAQANGVLTLTMPKAEKTKPTKVRVQVK